MGIKDIFGASKLKEENRALRLENNTLQEMLTPELRDAVNLKAKVLELNNDLAEILEDIKRNNELLSELKYSEATLNASISEKKRIIGTLDEEMNYLDFGLYVPTYDFATSEEYKDQLTAVRNHQKELINQNAAASFPTNFTYNNSVSKGQAIIKDNVKQILRSFNNECTVLIDKVKFNNVVATKDKIMAAYKSLNKLNSRMSISLTPSYLDLKIKELNLAYEYALKKQEEKERQKEERERLREEAKLQKELEEARKQVEKEQTHYTNALETLLKQLQENPENTDLLEKKAELESKIEDINHNLQDLDYRTSNKRAGYVYVISNIGSFGENIYKIGMTRRLDPMDRINELGDASVPFNFDVHALIFTEDAPGLESALHKAFETRKVNMVNPKREFFHVSLSEIENVVRQNYDKTVEFIKIPDAEQYRESQLMRQSN